VADTLTAEAAPSFLCDLSADARAAVLVDPDGELAGASEPGERGTRLAELTAELLDAIEAAAGGEPAAEAEAQVAGGSVYLVRRNAWALAVVARRSALSSLMLYDTRVVLSRVEEAGS
jgi:hypothetical protein